MAAEDIREEIKADPELGKIYEDARSALEAAGDSEALEEVRVAYLGRKGRLSVLLQGIKHLEPEEKRRVGRIGNLHKSWLESSLDENSGRLGRREMEEALADYRRALELKPGFADAHYNLAYTKHRMGATDEAREELGRTVILHPAHRLAWQLKLTIHLERGEHGDAEACRAQLQKLGQP